MTRQDEAFTLRLGGFTYAKIAEELGISKQRAHQLLRPPQETINTVIGEAEEACEGCAFHLGLSGHVHHRRQVGLTRDEYESARNLVYLCASCHRFAHHHSAFSPMTLGTRPQIGDLTALGQNATRFRRQCRFSRAEVAKLADLKYREVAAIETGEYSGPISLATLRALSRIFRVTVYDMVHSYCAAEEPPISSCSTTRLSCPAVGS